MSNTYFPRKNIHKHTWILPDRKTITQIKHILVKMRLKTSEQFRTFRGVVADSDHYLVIAKFALILSMKRKNKKQH